MKAKSLTQDACLLIAKTYSIRIEKHLQCEKLLGLAGKHQKAWETRNPSIQYV